jgi:Domain of unknown function (DUF5916)
VSRAEPSRSPVSRGRFRRALIATSLLATSASSTGAAAETLPPTTPPALTASAITEEVTIDGRLDERVWATAAAIESFVQIEPVQGDPPKRRTTVRVLFDARQIYFGFHCDDEAGPSGLRIPDLRRDFDFTQNDLVGVSLDPFGDGRTAQAFQVNPYGAQRDLRVTDGTQTDSDWDALWSAAARIEAKGWSAEIAIPWASLRYPAGPANWRANFIRRIRRDDEFLAWVEYPRAYSPYRMTYSGRIDGLTPPPPGKSLRATPYLLGRVDEPNGSASREHDLDVGGDFKWLPGSASVVDLTVNTDFAQADADRQVVNLSRFSVFFPEKRQFFLESGDLFDSGFDDVKPFFSRRIGLDRNGSPTPIDAGLRFVRQDARQRWGAMAIRTRETNSSPESTFAVGRFSRNLGERNRVGALAVHRRDEGRDDGRDGESGGFAAVESTVVSLDGLYRPREQFSLQGFWARSRRSEGGRTTEGSAGSLWTYFENEQIYVGLVEQFVSRDYDGSSGFVLDNNVIVTSPAVTLDWRPTWLPKSIRQLKPNVVGYLYHDHDDREFREGRIRIEPLWIVFQDGAEIWSWIEPNARRLSTPFSPLSGLVAEPGDYDDLRWGIAARTDRSRKLFGELRLLDGDFYGGRLEELFATVGASPSPKTVLRVEYERRVISRFGAANARRTTELWTPELRLAWSPRLQLTALYQRNTAEDEQAWNARLAWEFRPLSYIYLVYSQQGALDDRPNGPSTPILATGPTTRQLILKVAWSISR